MAILLSSANDLVIQRWGDLLKDKYILDQANSLPNLQKLCVDEKFDLLLLHRPLVDPETFSAIRRLSPLCKIFLLSDQPNEEEGLTFLKLGIVGYANTYISAERITEATRVISRGRYGLARRLCNV